jgi:hypothetical protein
MEAAFGGTNSQVEYMKDLGLRSNRTVEINLGESRREYPAEGVRCI